MVEVPECESKTQYLEADAAANAVFGQSPCRQDTRVWVTKEKVEKWTHQDLHFYVLKNTMRKSKRQLAKI